MANPGDVVTVDGVFLPQRVAEGGYRAMRAGLMATLFLEAQHLQVHKKSFDESLLDSLSEEESNQLDSEIQGKSVEAVIDVTQNLMDDNIPQEERIFDIIDV